MKFHSGAMVAGVLLSMGHARAEVQSFFNPNPLNYWTSQSLFSSTGRPLDLIQGPNPAELPTLERSLWYQAGTRASSGQREFDRVSALSLNHPPVGQSRFARSPNSTIVFGESTTTFEVFPLARFQPGDSVGPNQAWFSTVVCQFGSFSQPQLSTARGYIGVEFLLPDGVHYGFVECSFPSGMNRVYSWGYETEPGIPVVIPVPAPSTAVLISLAIAPWWVRRRHFR